MIKHIVMFKLKGTHEERLEAATRFGEALMELPEKIDCLRSMEVGINCNTSESWDIVLTAVVDNMEDLANYANHPLHVAAAATIKDCKEARACVDYLIDD